MKNKFILGLTIAFLAGFSVNNFAVSDVPSKIAVVDVQEVVASSLQVKNLKQEQEAKVKEMLSFVEKARKEVASVNDVNKKQTLEEKYSKEFADKKLANEKEYSKKLADIDKSISEQIAIQAKSQNYDVVLAKGVVLYGGEDITENVKNSLIDAEKRSKNSAKTKKKGK